MKNKTENDENIKKKNESKIRIEKKKIMKILKK